MIRDTNMYRGRIHIPGVAAARSGARRRPNLKRQLGFMHRLPSLRGDSCFCPCGTQRQSFPAEVCRTSSTFAGRVPRRETQQYVATPNKQLSPHGVSPIRPPATSDLERGSRGSRRRYIEVKAFGLVASRAAIMTGTRCRSRDTLVAVATLRWKLLKDWCRRKRRQAFPPRFLTLPLLADFRAHKKYRWRRDGFQPWTCRRRRDKGIPGAGWRRWQLADSWPASIRHRFRRWIRRAELAAPPLPHVPANGICRCHRSPLERRVGRARVIGQCAGHRKDLGRRDRRHQPGGPAGNTSSQGTRRYMFFEKVPREGRGEGPVDLGPQRDQSASGAGEGQSPMSIPPDLFLHCICGARPGAGAGAEKVCSFFSVSWDSGSYLGLLSAVRRRSGLVWSGLVRSAGLCHPSPRVT